MILHPWGPLRMSEMEETPTQPLQGVEEQEALTSILRGTASETGTRFFSALVQNLSVVLHTQLAWVTEYVEDEQSLEVSLSNCRIH